MVTPYIWGAADLPIFEPNSKRKRYFCGHAWSHGGVRNVWLWLGWNWNCLPTDLRQGDFFIQPFQTVA